MTKVSILIPAYNSANNIEETLRSVIDQSHKEIEVVVVDDGSSDSSLAILENLQKSHKNLIIDSQPNLGACAARNKAFELSTGDYIQYLDADDLLAPDKIANQVKLFAEYGNDIIVSGQWGRFYHNLAEAQFPTRFLDRDWQDPIDWLINSWEGKGMAQTAVWLTPRKLVEKAGPWNESLTINQDGEFFSRVLLEAKSIKFCKGAKVYYRSGDPKSVSNMPGKEKAESLLLSYQLYKKHVLCREDSERSRHALMMNFLSFMYMFYGKFPDLAQLSKEEIRMLGFNQLPPYGGKNFKRAATILGFENTLKIRRAILGN